MKIIILTYHPSALTNWVSKLVPYLKGCQLSVLHIAKLQMVQPIQISGITLIDVSNYSYKQANNLVKEISPDLFIFLSFRSILELTYLRICVKNAIPKVYLEHGLFSNDTLRFRPNKLKKDFGSTFRRQASFLWTHIGFILGNENKINELQLFSQIYFNKQFHNVPYEHYFLFSRRSFENYSKLFPMKEDENATYVGYPIFDDEKQKSLASVTLGKGVLYVHQPLISDGIATISYEEEKRWLLKISSLVYDKYGSMTILLHPRANIADYKKRFYGTGVEIVKSPNNFKIFADKSLIIGHYSSALLYGLYFEKPTVVLDYPSTKNDPLFSEIFTYARSIDELSTLDIHINPEKKEYMLGKHNTFEFIAKSILSYAGRRGE